MISTLCLAVVAGALTGAPAGGQSINVDYGDGSGTPASDFAAAGLPEVCVSDGRVGGLHGVRQSAAVLDLIDLLLAFGAACPGAVCP